MSVECYAGGRADERPLAVALDGKRLRVEEAKPAGVYEDAARRRWRSFIVRLEDGRRGELRHDAVGDCWTFQARRP